MLENQRICVVIPAFNEERLLPRTLEGIPSWVDLVLVIDDASQDQTSNRSLAWIEQRAGRDKSLKGGVTAFELIQHVENQGVGAAIRTGYQAAITRGADIIVVMAADNQMDPADLPQLLAPILSHEADYVKGNRFLHPKRSRMPFARRSAGYALGWLTSKATGYAISDSQCGYTAISSGALERLPLQELWPRYGYPNDLLALAAQSGLRVLEAPVAPVYADEQSGIRPWHFFSVCWLIGRRWLDGRAGARGSDSQAFIRKKAAGNEPAPRPHASTKPLKGDIAA